MKSSRNIDRIMLVITLLSIAGAYLIGINRATVDMEPLLPEVMKDADTFMPQDRNVYTAHNDDPDKKIIGYITLAEANGYGGPMKVIASITPNGAVDKILVVEHRETPSWYKKVLQNNYFSRLIGKFYHEDFEVGSDIDGITGATYTSKAIAEATKNAVRSIAATKLEFEVPRGEEADIDFGVPELVLVLLFITGWIGRKSKPNHRKVIRWISLLTAMIVLGFIYSRPLNLVSVNKFLIGFWPDWRVHLYWYMLIFGVFLVLITQRKNVYCGWFCPFGATQECIGVIGRAKPANFGRYFGLVKWIRRSVLWLAIIVAFIFRNPGMSSYEVFGTLFNMTGTTFQFFLLTIVLLASLFIYRPWCSILCPFRSFDEIIRFLRQEIMHLIGGKR